MYLFQRGWDYALIDLYSAYGIEIRVTNMDVIQKMNKNSEVVNVIKKETVEYDEQRIYLMIGDQCSSQRNRMQGKSRGKLKSGFIVA